MRPAESLLEQVQSLYEQGLYLQAHTLAERNLPLRQWEGTVGRILAGRLAGNLGGNRLANAYFVCAWRENPSDPLANQFRARVLLERHGPLAAWNAVREVDDWPDA